jgi:VCBS repeat-containing protein
VAILNYAGKFDANLAADALDLHLQGHGRIETITHHATHAPADAVIVADAHLLFHGEFKRSGVDLVLSGDDHELLLRDYFKTDKRAPLSSPDGAHLTGDIVTALTGYTQFAQAGGTSVGKVIGHVSKLAGTATAVRNGVSIILNNGDNVEKGDVVQSGSDSRLGITFIDGTVFGLSSNARMVLNEMVYDPNGSNNSSLLSLVAGTITFVAGETAKHGDMKVDTPVATMGIRGTAVLVEIDFQIPLSNVTPQVAPSAPTAKFQVLVEPDGTSGSYVLFDKMTQTLFATVNAPGTQTTISQGVVSFLATAPLSVDAQKIIDDVFTLKFTDINPKTNTGQNDSITPQSGTPVKLADADPVIPTFLALKNGKPASFDLNTVSDIFIPVHVGPSAVATGGASVELPGLVHSLAVDMASGVISFADTNINDRPTVSAAFTTFTYQNAQHNDITSTLTTEQLAAIAALEVPLAVVPAPGNTNNGSATWTYSVVDGAFDFMAAGEVLTLVYTATVDDGHGGSGTVPIAVTVTGTNDAPLITAQNLIGAVTQAGIAAGNLSNSGAISFSDVDLSDVHLVSALGTPIGAALGTLTVVKDSDTTGSGVGGHLTWTYIVADSAVAYLAAGETKVESFALTLDDQHGGTITKQIDVTVTGTNDAPVAVADVNAVNKETGPNPVSGNVLGNDTDVDTTDTHSVSAVNGASGNVGVDVAGTYGTLHLNDDGSYTYRLNNVQANVQALAEGQSVTDVFSYTDSDNHGGASSASLTITVTGTNDAPVAVADVNAVKEDTAPNPVSGNVLSNDTDVDTTDAHSRSTTPRPNVQALAEGQKYSAVLAL